MKRTELKRHTPLRSKTRIKARREKPRSHKLCIRLTGRALFNLRLDCFMRDGGICRECGANTYFQARFGGDPLAYDMAHIQSRGAGGSDTLENVRCLCHACHMKEHVGNL